MARKHHYRRKGKEMPELEITAFLNLMVVLVPFLLITAVFSRITIMELNVPSSAAGDGQTDLPEVVLEVVVRENALQISNGREVLESIAKLDDQYDIPALSVYLQAFKKNYPKKTDAIVLMEADIEYEYLIQVMDAVRGAEKQSTGSDAAAGANTGANAGANGDDNGLVERIILFPDVSVGDAP